MAAKKITPTVPAVAVTETPAESPAAESPAVESPVVDSPVEVVGSTDALTRITALTTIAHGLSNSMREMATLLKALYKDVAKLQKENDKKSKSRRRSPKDAAAASGKVRRPSGFAKPTGVSKELCDFLGLSADTKLARTEVTRLLTKYIKDNDLQDPDDRRTILPDDKLNAVVKVANGEKLTYFTLQTYMKNHFIKDAPATAVTA